VTFEQAAWTAIGVTSFSAIGSAVAVGWALLDQRGVRAMDVRLANGETLTITNRMPAEEVAKRINIIEQGLATFKTASAGNSAPARTYAAHGAGLQE
jgi:hypothetical protein